MTPDGAAWLLGRPGLFPFVGQFRLSVQAHGARCSIVGRIAAGAPIEQAHTVAQRVRSVLAAAPVGPWQRTDRHGLIRRIWQLLAEIPADRLGPAGGDDLTLLMLAQDVRGVAITGVGLAGAWAMLDGQYRALVSPGHPLLAPTGRPDGVPGVLTLDQACARVVGAPRPLDPVLPPAARIAERCGARRVSP